MSSLTSLSWSLVKPFAGVKKLVEAADKGFVLGAHAADDGFEAGLHLFGVFVLQVVVDQDDHRERKGFGGEDVDVLLDVILEDAELVAAEVRDEFAAVVLDGDGEDDEVGINGDTGLGVA